MSSVLLKPAGPVGSLSCLAPDSYDSLLGFVLVCTTACSLLFSPLFLGWLIFSVIPHWAPGGVGPNLCFSLSHFLRGCLPTPPHVLCPSHCSGTQIV